MHAIKVVAAVVQCTRSLLLCEDVGSEALHFADIEACTTRLPAIIADTQRAAGPERLVMGRCRFRLERNRPADASRLPSG